MLRPPPLGLQPPDNLRGVTPYTSSYDLAAVFLLINSCLGQTISQLRGYGHFCRFQSSLTWRLLASTHLCFVCVSIINARSFLGSVTSLISTTKFAPITAQCYRYKHFDSYHTSLLGQTLPMSGLLLRSPITQHSARFRFTPRRAFPNLSLVTSLMSFRSYISLLCAQHQYTHISYHTYKGYIHSFRYCSFSLGICQ